MKNNKIVVLLKYFKGELNPFDGAALECALDTGAEVTVLTMSPLSVLPHLQGLTRLGVKAVLISDPVYAGSDTQATSFILAEAIKRLEPDLIFCGRQSVDGDTGQVPPMLSQRLRFAIKAKVMSIKGKEITLRNGETYLLHDKTVVAFEKIRTLRFPSIFSKKGEVEVWDNNILGLPTEKCGQRGSQTKVIKSYESSVGRRTCQFVGAENLSRLIETGLEKQRVEQTQTANEKLEKVYFVGTVRSVALGIANVVSEIETQGKTVEQIAKETKGKTVLWEDGEENKIIASKVAVLTGAGLCADCISFQVENGNLIMTRPALGGNVTADIVATGDTVFATVRTAKKEGSNVIFSVGKGAVEYIDEIQEFAKKYGAEVCCSRVVADSGKLPYQTQVGLTGKTVSPKVYVAFGISGAVQHTCAIAGAGTVIAVNVDKQARIFDYADYGIIMDIKDLIEGEKNVN